MGNYPDNPSPKKSTLLSKYAREKRFIYVKQIIGSQS